jgi:hypothetical protein
VGGVFLGEELATFAAEAGEGEALVWACIGALRFFKAMILLEERGGGATEGGGGGGGIRSEEEAEEVGAGLGEAVVVLEDGAVAQRSGEKGEAGGGEMGIRKAKRLAKAVGESLEGAREALGGVFRIYEFGFQIGGRVFMVRLVVRQGWWERVGVDGEGGRGDLGGEYGFGVHGTGKIRKAGRIAS